MSFLPSDYELPKSKSNYMRFEKGENKFRILGDAIVGWEGWKKDTKGINRPVRVRQDETINVDDVDDESRIKHFWAFVVFNYAEEKVQILEITQKGIMKSVNALEQSKDWGDPKNYDILVVKTGEGLDTEYSVNPAPPKKLDEGIVKYYKDMEINLEALFDNDDPFKASEQKKQDDFVDEVSKAIDKE